MSSPRDRIEARLGLSGPPLQGLRDTPPAIPDHELIRRIGQGAYGEVWLARNALGTWRAVKIVHRDTFQDARPYEREFAGIRRFEPLSRTNEGFVDILQVGRDDAGGWFYYVMELADAAGDPGGSIQEAQPDGKNPPEAGTGPAGPSTVPLPLDEPAAGGGVERTAGFDSRNPELYQPRTLARDLQQRGRRPLEDCLELGLTLTLALGHLHRHGLIHRDIKPANIVYVAGVPKLADIGLVTEAQGANTFVGTEGFVPPEGPTSTQADLFALGKVLYEASMGKDRNEFPEPFTQIGPDAESVALMELNAVLLRACAPDPAQRYASAEEMHADLALLHSGGSVKRRHQFERQLHLAKRVSAAAVIALLLIGGAWLWQRQQTERMTRLAEEKSSLAAEKTRLAESLAKADAENRDRIVRLDIANGVRLLEEGDPAGALLWFADALPLLTNNPAQESIHRIRIQQTLNRIPRVRRVFPHESGLTMTAYSPDGQFILTGTKDGNVRVWNAAEGTLLWTPRLLPGAAYFGRFTRDGKRLLLGSATAQGTFNGALAPVAFYGVLDARTGMDWKWPKGALRDSGKRLIGAFFSTDDRWLATGHGDGVIRVFDLEAGRLVVELRGHTNEVRSIAFSGDGTLLASASLDRTVRLWRLPGGEAIGEPLKQRWPVVRVLLTDDGQRAVGVACENVGDDGGVEIQVWNTATGEPLSQPIKARDRVGVFLSPESPVALLVQDKAPHQLRLHGMETGRELATDLKVVGVRSWDFAPDGSRVALGFGNHSAQVFDLRRGVAVTKPFRHGVLGVNSVSFSPGGSELLTGCDDGTARIWDLRPAVEETASARVPGGVAPGYSTRGRQQFGRSGDRFYVRAGGGATVAFDQALQVIHQFKSEQMGKSLYFESRAPDGMCTAFRIVDHQSKLTVAIRLGSEKDGELRQLDLPHPAPVIDIVFTPDSRHVVTCAEDRLVRFWNARDGSLERTVTTPGGDTGGLSTLSPDGRTGLWWDWDIKEGVRKAVRFVDLDSGTFMGETVKMPSTVYDEVFSPTGRFIAFTDKLGPVIVVESRTGRRISSGIRHPGSLDWLQWDLREERLLTAGDQDDAFVWDLKGGARPRLTLNAPGSSTRTGRWSADGRLIVTVGKDRKVRVWDASTGEPVTPAFEHDYVLAASAIIGSNRLVSVAYAGKAIRAWDLIETPLPATVLVDYAQYISGRRLDAAGAPVTLSPEDLAALGRSLLATHPELFSSPTNPAAGKP